MCGSLEKPGSANTWEANGLFFWQKQTITQYREEGEGVVVQMDYEGVLAKDGPLGMRAGQTLKLTGLSAFGFCDGRIIRIIDQS